MIVYHHELFGFHLLPRAHGSAVYRAMLPSSISTCVLLIGAYGSGVPPGQSSIISNPYAVGAFVAFFTYLVTFRANFAYKRYWEGATSVYLMMSKWIDVGMNMAAYHYQCRQYAKVRPPAFGKNTSIRNLTRERERMQKMTEEQLKEDLLKREEEEERQRNSLSKNKLIEAWRERQRKKRKRRLGLKEPVPERKSIHSKTPTISYTLPAPSQSRQHDGKRRHRRGETRPSQQFDNDFLRSVKQEPTLQGGVDTPSLFLQESAHLLSLMSAVAMSTLRSNIKDDEPPLVEHVPGRPWPPVDPDCLSAEIRKEFNETSHLWTTIYFLLGWKGRSNRDVTLYNAARPFRVLGGVSDEEMSALGKARGPEAKVQLCALWLQEFISREYMAGSTGGVAPPIISRLYHFISDGMIGYNQSRKVCYIPFPFPHAQLTTIFIGVCVFVFPLLFYGFVNNLVFACIFNFVTVSCFVGVHEVARELEQPFFNVPNDLPLTTFQAQFNEALIAMYAGFHPDAWSVEEQVTSVASKEPLNKEEPSEEKKEEESGKKPSLDALDLLSFFRTEREEAEKSKEKDDAKGNKLAGSPDPTALLKKATNAIAFFGGEWDGSSTSPVPIVASPKSILKKSHESSYQGTSEQNEAEKPKEKEAVKGNKSDDSPDPKALLKRATHAVAFFGGECDGSSTSSVPMVASPKSILKQSHESSYQGTSEQNDNESIESVGGEREGSSTGGVLS